MYISPPPWWCTVYRGQEAALVKRNCTPLPPPRFSLKKNPPSGATLSKKRALCKDLHRALSPDPRDISPDWLWPPETRCHPPIFWPLRVKRGPHSFSPRVCKSRLRTPSVLIPPRKWATLQVPPPRVSPTPLGGNTIVPSQHAILPPSEIPSYVKNLGYLNIRSQPPIPGQHLKLLAVSRMRLLNHLSSRVRPSISGFITCPIGF